MEPFNQYVDSLENLVQQTLRKSSSDQFVDEISAALDGAPSRFIRSNVSLNNRRIDGIFFTGHVLAEQLVSSVLPRFHEKSVIFDPACGVGNLFTAFANHLPITDDLTGTIKLWGNVLQGFDLHSSFIRATKARLILSAIQRGVSLHKSEIDFGTVFPQIRVGDSLQETDTLSGVDHVILNPPFSTTQAPPNYQWANGKVSKAALFLESCISRASEGTQITAILPDVLRSGSHYQRWRQHIEKHSIIESIELGGCFDSFTDVNTFIVRLVVASDSATPRTDWWKPTGHIVQDARTVDQDFEVHVGPVVPHRHPKLGQWHPYLVAQELPTWTIINSDTQVKKRRFQGTLYSPPFVVVRRTSRPDDDFRAVSTVIKGKLPVAVENHLLIVKPKRRSITSCLNLMERFQSIRVNDWLNERIRCRHLTVSSLGKIPL